MKFQMLALALAATATPALAEDRLDLHGDTWVCSAEEVVMDPVINVAAYRVSNDDLVLLIETFQRTRPTAASARLHERMPCWLAVNALDGALDAFMAIADDAGDGTGVEVSPAFEALSVALQKAQDVRSRCVGPDLEGACLQASGVVNFLEEQLANVLEQKAVACMFNPSCPLDPFELFYEETACTAQAVRHAVCGMAPDPGACN